MKIEHCLVITAYKDVNMLRCLLETTEGKFHIFCHIDNRKWSEFSILEKEFPNINFSHKYTVKWGV